MIVAILLVGEACQQREPVTERGLDVQEAVLRHLLKEIGLDSYHPMLHRIAPRPHSYCWFRLNPGDPTNRFLKRFDDIQAQLFLSNPHPTPRDSLNQWGHEFVVDSVTWVNSTEATVHIDDRIHFKREFFHVFLKDNKWIVWQPTVITDYDSDDPSRSKRKGLIM